MSAKWPSPQEFNEAIQTPSLCFDDLQLRAGTVELNALGLPRVESGNFANVYKVTCSDGDWAVRCFTSEVADSEMRYNMLSDFILHDDLIYTVTFHFQKKGIKVGRNWFPIVKMEWVQGEHFIPWIDRNIQNPQKIIRLAERFLEMAREMQDSGIAHGDLQHGNMIIVGDDFRLVDYDGMYVPAMRGMASNELGHSNYQHPGRDSYHFGSYLDNFSAWLIFASMQIIARDESLWTDYARHNGETLLFTRSDLAAPADSKIFKIVLEHKNKDIRAAAQSILDMLAVPPEQVPPPVMTRNEVKMEGLPKATWLDKVLRRGSYWLKQRDLRKQLHKQETPQKMQQKPARQENQVTAQSVFSSRPLPEWLNEWMIANPPQTRAPKPAPTVPPPTIREPVQPQPAAPESTEPPAGPMRLKEYEIRRLLERAATYSNSRRFRKARYVLQAAQDAARVSGAPAIVLDSIRAEAQILSAEGKAHLEEHRYHEATTCYESAARRLDLVADMRHNPLDKADDLARAHALAQLAAVYTITDDAPKARRALQKAIDLLSAYSGTKAEIAHLQKRLQSGNNQSNTRQ